MRGSVEVRRAILYSSLDQHLFQWTMLYPTRQVDVSTSLTYDETQLDTLCDGKKFARPSVQIELIINILYYITLSKETANHALPQRAAHDDSGSKGFHSSKLALVGLAHFSISCETPTSYHFYINVIYDFVKCTTPHDNTRSGISRPLAMLSNPAWGSLSLSKFVMRYYLSCRRMYVSK